jgi:membrane protein implicated in regulation of membrane protease activity
MYSAYTLSLSCLVLACLVGVVIWMIVREHQRRKRGREEALKRRIQEFTGQKFVTGHTTVEDLEREYGKKG